MAISVVRIAIILSFFHAVLAVTPSSVPIPILLQLANCSVPGTAVDAYGVELMFSDPSQYVCLTPSTVVNSTLLIDSTFCQNYPNMTAAQCQSLCGNTYNTAAAETSFNSSSSTSILGVNSVWTKIAPEPLLAGNTSLELPPSNSIANFPLGLITDGIHQNLGHLGLATNSELMRSAYCNRLIPANGFGFNAGSQSMTNPRGGSLVLGGYDLSSINGAWKYFPVSSTSSSERPCPFQVNITELAIRFPHSDGSLTDILLSGSGSSIIACIEIYDNLPRFPQTVIELFKESTGWNSSFTFDPTFIIDEPGLYYPQAKGFNGSLVVTLDNGFVAEIHNEEMTNPLRRIDVNGARVLEPSINEVNIFYLPAPLNTATLGRKFLSQFYLAADYSNDQFMLAPIVSQPGGTDLVAFDSTFVSCSPPKISKSLGLRIGLPVGLIGFFLVAIASLFCFWKRICSCFPQRTQQQDNSSTELSVYRRKSENLSPEGYFQAQKQQTPFRTPEFQFSIPVGPSGPPQEHRVGPFTSDL